MDSRTYKSLATLANAAVDLAPFDPATRVVLRSLVDLLAEQQREIDASQRILQETQRELQKQTHAHYLKGISILRDVNRATQATTRRHLILQAQSELYYAVEVETGLIKANALFGIAACHDLQKERALAIDYYKQTYILLSQHAWAEMRAQRKKTDEMLFWLRQRTDNAHGHTQPYIQEDGPRNPVRILKNTWKQAIEDSKNELDEWKEAWKRTVDGTKSLASRVGIHVSQPEEIDFTAVKPWEAVDEKLRATVAAILTARVGSLPLDPRA